VLEFSMLIIVTELLTSENHSKTGKAISTCTSAAVNVLLRCNVTVILCQ